MNQPKVSVLISFYNLAPYVDKTMETVLAQKTISRSKSSARTTAPTMGRSKSCASGKKNIPIPCAFL